MYIYIFYKINCFSDNVFDWSSSCLAVKVSSMCHLLTIAFLILFKIQLFKDLSYVLATRMLRPQCFVRGAAETQHFHCYQGHYFERILNCFFFEMQLRWFLNSFLCSFSYFLQEKIQFTCSIRSLLKSTSHSELFVVASSLVLFGEPLFGEILGDPFGRQGFKSLGGGGGRPPPALNPPLSQSIHCRTLNYCIFFSYPK